MTEIVNLYPRRSPELYQPIPAVNMLPSRTTASMSLATETELYDAANYLKLLKQYIYRRRPSVSPSDESEFNNNDLVVDQSIRVGVAEEFITESDLVSMSVDLDADAIKVTLGPSLELETPSPTVLGCCLCSKDNPDYRNQRIPLDCCKKGACLKCLAIWFIGYGHACPFCNAVKKNDDLDIVNLLCKLTNYPEILTEVLESLPSRRCATRPLLPQHGLVNFGDTRTRLNVNDIDTATANATLIMVTRPGDLSNRSASQTKEFEKKMIFLIVLFVLFLFTGVAIITYLAATGKLK